VIGLVGVLAIEGPEKVALQITAPDPWFARKMTWHELIPIWRKSIGMEDEE
jgi:hypothetical protein